MRSVGSRSTRSCVFTGLVQELGSVVARARRRRRAADGRRRALRVDAARGRLRAGERRLPDGGRTSTTAASRPTSARRRSRAARWATSSGRPRQPRAGAAPAGPARRPHRAGPRRRASRRSSRSRRTAAARDLRVRGARRELLRYVVEKGSVAVDGVSLTVTDVDERGFGVSLIPETLERTNLTQAEPGRRVNLEVDVLAKYVEKLVATGAR